MQTPAYGTHGPTEPLQPITITRRDVGEEDVAIDIIYAGICHSDIHTARSEWKGTKYPCVPGHEILGRVNKVGSKVTKFKTGDLVGVGCLVNSCRTCDNCKTDEEQFCLNGGIFTYNSTDRDGTTTYGGYSTYVVVTEHFVVKIPETFGKLEGIAPLLCAGITTYSPLRQNQSKVGPGKKVAINGLGGLGHMGVKFAVAMGADVTVLSTSPSKEGDAKKLGAHHFVISKDADAMKAVAGSFDLILDTVSAEHDIAPLIASLKTHGVLSVVGAPPSAFNISPHQLIFGHKTVVGSLIGGIKETQEMIDYCAKHNIVSDVEVISANQINDAYERTMKSDVKYRFVIDIKTLKPSA